MKKFLSSFFLLIAFCAASVPSFSQVINIKNNSAEKYVAFGNQTMSVTLDYNNKVNISRLLVNGQEVIKGNAGVYSAIKTKNAAYSTLQLQSVPVLTVNGNTIIVSKISYGDKEVAINETWTFIVEKINIKLNIDRTCSKAIVADQVAFPAFMFANMETWEGAYQDYGGLAWFYLFNKKLDTYGVHSSCSRFWNSKTNNGLSISVDAPGRKIATDYSRTEDDKLACTISLDQHELLPRFDSGTNRRRFIRDRNDVWAPVTIAAGKTTEHIVLSYFSFNDQFGRGNLVGINAGDVSGVLNTIARIGVIDKQHFGGNSWHTPYGPICLHEQYIAQIGLGVNDRSYLKGYQDCLDFYRDHAFKKDGRVFSRWAYTNEDMMKGEVNSDGFYEAQWGYLLDANPDFVTNVAELYDQTGDAAWVKTQQLACEKALDWILKRDSNKNGLVEMMTSNHTERKGSDWIDIIWASYENAFVNAKLYRALFLWANIEKQLGNNAKQKYYSAFAEKLKSTFNKPVTEGGFWDEENKCYVHWRDKDGSVHGRNMVTPVNFMAIAYGICDDEARTKRILDDIEVQMQKENLFFWPLCLYSYGPGEGNDWQFPFPNYENGDIFLSWGSVAVKAYASYKPALALKYVNNVLAQYAKDGLAFQRYGRAKQDGLGDDILSGNSLSVIGLYQAIYGINPMYNRFYLDPHITEALAGTRVNYLFREQELKIDLAMNKYSVSNGRFSITSNKDFGFFNTGDKLFYFDGNAGAASLTVTTNPKAKLDIAVSAWGADKIAFTQTAVTAGKLKYTINNLSNGAAYTISVNGKLIKKIKSMDGTLLFEYIASVDPAAILITK